MLACLLACLLYPMCLVCLVCLRAFLTCLLCLIILPFLLASFVLGAITRYITLARHNWGSPHDDDNSDSSCRPAGNEFLMYPVAVDGTVANNLKLSTCSQASILSVLQSENTDCFEVSRQLHASLARAEGVAWSGSLVQAPSAGTGSWSLRGRTMRQVPATTKNAMKASQVSNHCFASLSLLPSALLLDC